MQRMRSCHFIGISNPRFPSLTREHARRRIAWCRHDHHLLIQKGRMPGRQREPTAAKTVPPMEVLGRPCQRLAANNGPCKLFSPQDKEMTIFRTTAFRSFGSGVRDSASQNNILAEIGKEASILITPYNKLFGIKQFV
jgi:hypothetical protein